VNYLLDTHVFLWTVFRPENLREKALRAIESSDNAIYVSTVTFWETSLKYGLGKLVLRNVLPDSLPELSRQMGFESLPVDDRTASTFHMLPKDVHKDPFDRLIVWQAINQGLVLITKDTKLGSYRKIGLKTLWR
jgi:PIN domain nuclease of toxin-antitoxin system